MTETHGKRKWHKTHGLVKYLTMSVTTYIVMFLTQSKYLFFNEWREYKIKKLLDWKNYQSVVEVEALGLNVCWKVNDKSFGSNGVEKTLGSIKHLEY